MGCAFTETLLNRVWALHDLTASVLRHTPLKFTRISLRECQTESDQTSDAVSYHCSFRNGAMYVATEITQWEGTYLPYMRPTWVSSLMPNMVPQFEYSTKNNP